LPGDGHDLLALDRRLPAVLVGERIVVTACDEPLFGRLDDPVGRQPAALDLLGVEDDDIALFDWTSHRRGDRDEPVTGLDGRCHALTGDVTQEHRLAEHLARDEREHTADQKHADSFLEYSPPIHRVTFVGLMINS
jgi:hypothetical protein